MANRPFSSAYPVIALVHSRGLSFAVMCGAKLKAHESFFAHQTSPALNLY